MQATNKDARGYYKARVTVTAVLSQLLSFAASECFEGLLSAIFTLGTR